MFSTHNPHWKASTLKPSMQWSGNTESYINSDSSKTVHYFLIGKSLIKKGIDC